MSELIPLQTLKFTGNQSISFLNSLFKTPPPEWNLVSELDLAEVSFITPIICAVAGVARVKGWAIVQPTDTNARNYLSYMLQANEFRSCERYIPVISCKSKSESDILIRKVREVFKDWVPESTVQDIIYYLYETFDNVFDHAQSEDGCWLHAQKYPGIDVVEIVLIDTGRGISESMKDNPEYSNLSAEERFQRALEIGVTSTPSRHSGQGLSSTLEWIKLNRQTKARGVVLSHQNLWFAGKTKFGVVDLTNTSWPGTLLWFQIPFLPLKSLNDTWEMLGLTAD